LLKKVSKPNVFGQRCTELELKWSRQKRTIFHLKKIIDDADSLTTIDEIRSKLKEKEIILSRGQVHRLLRQQKFKWRTVQAI
jgi:hypothetical protein